MARVKLEGVRKTYQVGRQAHTVVHDVDLEIADGEIVVLVGPSGSGKSTILRMIAGLESISAGRLLIGDRVVNDVPPKARDIAMVFQNYALYPHMTAYENMAFALTLRRTPRAEIDARVREAAAVLGIEALLDRKPRQMSGGQRQRVAVGRALVRKPQVFLFDEPLSNLDAKLRVQMRQEIASLHRRLGATMVYVTHDQVEAMTLGDRIVVLSDGRVQQVGAPLALYDRPRNRFVAEFIGSPSMNIVPGEIVRGGTGAGGTRFVAEGGAFSVPLASDIASALAARGAPGARTGARVLLGVRPEAVSIEDDSAGSDVGGSNAGGGATADVKADVKADAASDASDAVPMRLELVEPMGNEMFVHVSAGEHRLVARTAPHALPDAGAMVGVRVDPRRLHFFDAESGARIE